MQAPTTQQQDTEQKPSFTFDSTANDVGNNDQSQPEEAAEATPQAYETTHVHNVYNEIAEHFSQTRYKPWPIVSSFLRARAPGSVGLDIGCGNGKYLAENDHVFILASDTSDQLLRLAREHHGARTLKASGTNRPATQDEPENQASQDPTHELNTLLLASTLNLPHPHGRFDFAISIAVIHHLSTRERRVSGIQEILSCLRSDTGKALFYVWALEQQSSRRGWDASSEQDVMVPWVLTPRRKLDRTDKQAARTYRRYYHLYREGELEDDVRSASGCVLDAGYERDNWWVVAVRM